MYRQSDQPVDEPRADPPEQETSGRQDDDALLEVRASIGPPRRHCAYDDNAIEHTGPLFKYEEVGSEMVFSASC